MNLDRKTQEGGIEAGNCAGSNTCLFQMSAVGGKKHNSFHVFGRLFLQI